MHPCWINFNFFQKKKKILNRTESEKSQIFAAWLKKVKDLQFCACLTEEYLHFFKFTEHLRTVKLYVTSTGCLALHHAAVYPCGTLLDLFSVMLKTSANRASGSPYHVLLWLHPILEKKPQTKKRLISQWAATLLLHATSSGELHQAVLCESETRYSNSDVGPWLKFYYLNIRVKCILI